MLMMKTSVMMMILMKDTADSSGRWRPTLSSGQTFYRRALRRVNAQSLD
jgi:hypothetical protein